MRPSFFTALAVVAGSSRLLVSAAAVASIPSPAASIPTASIAPLPINAFTKWAGTPLTPDQLRNLTDVDDSDAVVSTASSDSDVSTTGHGSNGRRPSFNTFASCSNPRYRIEWHRMSSVQKKNFVNAVRCLMQQPASGKYSNSKNRYEDLVALHQAYTPNIHGNGKFLLWHRYFLFMFEWELRNQCGFATEFPWFDETRYAGRFSQSDIFSNEHFGPISYPNGGCVTTGPFANLALNVGPGSGNQLHCLQRHGNGAVTSRITQSIVNYCNQYSSFATMASCSEGQAHAFGHNGVGGVMMDMYASVGDPFFFLHHAFVDHSYRVWQNANPVRVTSSGLGGVDKNGAPITMNTGIFVNGVGGFPDVRVADIINTMGESLCYRYDY